MPVAQPAQRRRRPARAAPTSTSAICVGLLHRRLDAVEPELVGGLLGEVDDVVERAGERVARRPASSGARRAAAPASRWRMSWAIRSPSCSHSDDLARELARARGSRRAGRAAAARCAARCGPTPRTGRAARRRGGAQRSAHTLDVRAAPRRRRPFTACSQRVHGSVTGRPRQPRAGVLPAMAQRSRHEVLTVGDAGDPPAPSTARWASGRALSLSVREFELLVGAGAPRRAASCRARTSTRRSGERRCAPATARSTSTSTSCG